jgi:hypothetical protein
MHGLCISLRCSGERGPLAKGSGAMTLPGRNSAPTRRKAMPTKIYFLTAFVFILLTPLCSFFIESSKISKNSLLFVSAHACTRPLLREMGANLV